MACGLVKGRKVCVLIVRWVCGIEADALLEQGGLISRHFIRCVECERPSAADLAVGQRDREASELELL